MDTKLTYGQACYLVLGFSPNKENREKAKLCFDTRLLDVCYMDSFGSMRPIAIGRDLLSRDPFTYRCYTTTRPSSPSKIPDCSTEDTEHIEDGSDDNNEADTYDLLPVTKGSVLHVLKKILSSTQPSNSEMYEKTSVDQTVLQSILSKYFVKEPKSLPRVMQWMSADGSFGRADRMRVSGEQVRGRWLWRLKKCYQVPINFHKEYKRHVDEAADVVTIGYARKSYGNEAVSTRVRLLQLQVDKLRDRCLAKKVFVSSRCSAAMPLEVRDRKQGDDMVRSGQLDNCAGTMQYLIHRLRTNMKPVRLVVIDYAGLSIDFEDIHQFVSKFKQIVELVVDVEYSFDIIPRADVLSDNNVSTRFNCRIGPQKRSRALVED